MPHARSTQDDAGVSSIIGFIVGFALLAGSMAAVAYFMITIPDTGTPEESKDLESFVQNAADALTKSPGHPHEWHESDCQADTYGLLRAGSSIAQLDKLTCFKTGDANATTLLEANDLRNEGIRLYAEGTVVPLSTMKAPSTTEYALLAGDLAGNDLDDVTTDGTSQEVLTLYQNADDGFESTVHEWAWRLDRHPEEGLGNTFVDHPWHVHTQLGPVMAGLQATYSFHDPYDFDEDGEDWGTAATEAADTYDSTTGQPERLTRWHVAADGAPRGLPGSHDVEDGHAFTVNYHRGQGSDSAEGVGQWRTVDGERAFALVGKVDVTGAGDASLSFWNLLRASSGESGGGWTDCHAEFDHPDDYVSCVEIRPSIRYWNTSGSQDPGWSRLDPEQDCIVNPDHAWNDTGDEMATGGSWESRTVDLCETLEHTDGELWIGLEWFSECKDASGDGTSCQDLMGGDENNAPRGWFIDDLTVTVDEEAVFETTFKIEGGMKTLVASQGLDHGLVAGWDDDRVVRLLAPISAFVGDGGNLLSFAPGSEGAFFTDFELNAISYAGSDPVKTIDADRLVMRMPHKLPLEHNDYEATSVAWDPSQDLDVVQWTEDEAAATLVTKTTSNGAKVTGVAYDVTSMDTDLRDKLLDNIYTSAVFLDPTFTTEDASIPDRATVPVSSAQRIVLAEATETGEHHVPLEVTVYAWPEGLG